jgi:hypothetical protein
MRRRYNEHTRFLALRACWRILRGGSVAWNLDMTDEGFRSRGGKGMFVGGCTDHGEPIGPEQIYHRNPEGQER